MRPTGALVLCFFATLWAFLTLHLLEQPIWVQAMPAVVSLILGMAAILTGRHAARPTAENRRRIYRTVGLWSVIEFVVIFGGASALRTNGHGEWTTAFVAAVVGLHLYPLAMGLRAPIYWVTGLGLVCVAAAAVTLMPFGVPQSAVIGAGCAAILWLTALVIIASAGKTRAAQA